MSVKIEGQHRSEYSNDTAETEQPRSRPVAAKPSQPKPPVAGSSKPLGTDSLVKATTKRVIPSAIYPIDPKSADTAQAAKPAPAKDQTPKDAKDLINEKLEPHLKESGRQFARPVPAPLPAPAPKSARRIPASDAPGAPPDVRAEAGRRLDALETKHEKLRTLLEQSIRHWQKTAADLKKNARDNQLRGIHSDELSQSVWHAERQADSGREMLRALNVDFADAKHELRVLVGETDQAGFKKGTGIDPNAPKPLTALERLQAKIDQYNKSVDTLKSSGVLIQPVAIAYVAGVELGGRELEKDDLRALDGIYGLGNVLNVPLGAYLDRHSGLSGAASPAPGVDYRERNEPKGGDGR